MKTMIFCCVMLLGSASVVAAHSGTNELMPIGRYGSLELERRILQDNDTDYMMIYNDATIRMPKLRLSELLDALQNLRSNVLIQQDMPLILHGGLQVQEVVIYGISYMRITDRKKRSTLLTPEQQDNLIAALEQEVNAAPIVSMN